MKNQIEANKLETANAKTLYGTGSKETGQSLSDSASLQTPEAVRRKQIMIAIWERMGQWFGPLWEQGFGTIHEKTINAWMDAMGEFGEDDIARAMHALAKWESKYPPTFPEFRALIMAHRPKENFTDRRIESEKGEIKSLADFAKPRREDGPIAKREKERMRRILAGEDVESKEESMTKLGLHRRWQT